MKNDRNYGMPPYPIYQGMGQPMMGTQPMITRQPMMGPQTMMPGQQMMGPQTTSQSIAKNDQLYMLQQEVNNLNRRLENIERRINSLENMMNTTKQPYKNNFNNSDFQII